MESFKYDKGMKVYTVYDWGMELSGKWLFNRLGELGCDICTYSYNDDKLDLYGEYPKDTFIGIKKFFYDNYPYSSLVEPRKYGIRIHFKTKISFNYNSLV